MPGQPLTPSILRVIQNVRKVGLANAWRQINYIGDTKAGHLAGIDEHGNKYYENTDETLWRHRWVDYAQHDFNSSQVPPEWHSWLCHIRLPAPPVDPVMQAARKSWQTPHHENLSGTRGAYKPYSTVKPKVIGWEPKPAQRG